MQVNVLTAAPRLPRCMEAAAVSAAGDCLKQTAARLQSCHCREATALPDAGICLQQAAARLQR